MLSAFAQEPNGGLVVTASAPAQIHRALLISLAAQHRLPAVFPYLFYAADNGLTSYGIDDIETFRLAAAKSIASSRGKSRPIFRCWRRPSTR
jgi:putative ABC transport system substrate-binding protein